MNIELISIEDPLYQQERELRNKILLRPIGVPDFGWEMHDKESWHFVAVDEKKVTGCVVLVPLNEERTKVQLIQMAVDKNFQKKGIGKTLVNKVISFCKKNNIHKIEIHSRADVISFYEQLGFTVIGKPFKEVGILHRYMRKYL
jgi:predicted GNAT family N-acyltransferase